MKKPGIIGYIRKKAILKTWAITVCLAMLLQILAPSIAFGLTSGPSQPEVQSFEPVETSKMVDLPTGDLTYNIPLLDIDGYPVNISYHSGIGMDQEASWVGLGWNINPGVINRGVRGIPDDFSGDVITKKFNMKDNETWAIGTNISFEIVGCEAISLGFSLGGKYNSYNGIGMIQGMSISVSSSDNAKSSTTGSLGLSLTNSTEDGLTVEPSASFSAKAQASEKKDVNMGASVGIGFNSRSGLGSLTVGVSVSASAHEQKKTNTTGDAKGDETGKSSETPVKSSLIAKKSSAGLKSMILSRGLNPSSSFDFGSPTYSPSAELSMKSFAISGRFTLGGEIYSIAGSIGMNGSYSNLSLVSKELNTPSYGYLYSALGQQYDDVNMDFNREKDVPFTGKSDNLPLTNFTFDTYSVCGQGIGGSYRPYRSDFGYVFDPKSKTTSDSYSVGLEIGIGNTAHSGGDLSMTDVTSRTGKWTDNNEPANRLYFRRSGPVPIDYEECYFKEANEKSVETDPEFFKAIGGFEPQRFELDKSQKYDDKITNNFIDSKGNKSNVTSNNFRKHREKRNQVISFLKGSEYQDFAIQPYTINEKAKPHHIAEYTALGTDGSRYIYDLPAYNTLQQEVTFAIGSDQEGKTPDQIKNNGLDYVSGLISYNKDKDNTASNTLGKDHYFSSIETPAYAHSYFLTSILSPDYVDNDAMRGPSDNDLGNYTRFSYTYKRGNTIFKWRTPMEQNKASYNEGLKSNTTDDKASYIYGEKELIYVDYIETKNYKAVFYITPRADGHGVIDNNGGVDYNCNVFKLDSIALFSKADIAKNGVDAIAIKKVIFEYDYSLCQGVPNNDHTIPDQYGKLTLKKIYFSYQNSYKARLSPYEFSYESGNPMVNDNPSYCIKNYDRWGGYKASSSTVNNYGVDRESNITSIGNYISMTSLPIAEFPYVIQNKETADVYSSVWHLTKIDLPSGGSIKISYESDDYAYVQDKRAMQMFKIINILDITTITNPEMSNQAQSFSGTGVGQKLYFNLQDQNDNVSDYFKDIDLMYFKCLTDILSTDQPNLEYVPGYAKIASHGPATIDGIKYGWVTLEGVNLGDGNTITVNPIIKAAIQFGMAHLPKIVWGDNMNVADGEPLGIKIIKEIWSSSVLKGVIDAVRGPNRVMYDKGVGHKIITGKSWIRLNNPNKRKFGGGCRVKKIEMYDNWGAMVGNTAEDYFYGQQYSYNLEDGTSSGVATYEPLVGGDENPLRMPFYTNIKKVLVPDEKTYVETPFGESFFPSPNVVYSRVTVANLSRPDVTHHATGRTVSEFYTAKDFPAITKKTGVDGDRDKPNVISLGSIFKFIKHKDYYTGTQGYCIELNDMAGKPKSQSVYQEGNDVAISSSEYIYKKDDYKSGSFRLNNQCKAIHPDGSVSDETLGVNYDFVADMRESKTDIYSVSAKINLDAFLVLCAAVSIPMIWPGYTSERTLFRSGVTTKVIQRFGILEEIITKEDASVTSMKNLAFDSETGEPLLTKSNNNFNDIYYTMKFPAYWYYKNMGQASKNLGIVIEKLDVKNGWAKITNANQYFVEGDELAMSGSVGAIKVWVKVVNDGNIYLIDKSGNCVTGTYNIKVIRSGNRNTLTNVMTQLVTSKNPLNGLKTNIYEEVLESTAQEYSNIWKTYCECFTDPAFSNYSENPFILGTNSYWKPWKSYAYLTGRVQSKYDNNTNIRKDGKFASFNPFYKNVNGNWLIDYKNWTFSSEVTEFSPYGVEIENKDALGRYSASTYGYNQTLPISVASNARHQEIGFDGFEDYDVKSCSDNHFKFKMNSANMETAHTGTHSIKVNSNSEQNMIKDIQAYCEKTSACELKFTISSVSTPIPPKKDVLAIDGNAPYAYEWNILSGSPSVNLKLNGNGVEIKGSSCQVEVTVTDAKGCLLTEMIEIN